MNNKSKQGSEALVETTSKMYADVYRTERRPYVRPTIVEYGRLSDLTATHPGGSTVDATGSPSSNKSH